MAVEINHNLAIIGLKLNAFSLEMVTRQQMVDYKKGNKVEMHYSVVYEIQ